MITLRASSVRSFHETPDNWYKQHILDEDKFEGNYSTVLGSIVHKFAEAYYTLEEWSPYDILDESILTDEEKVQAIEEYPAMCKALEELYLQHHKPTLTEHYMFKDYGEFRFQGTCDALENEVLCDYKTSKSPKKKIDEYTQQLNIYAHLMELTGRKVTKLRVINIVRATKRIPPRVNVLECIADPSEGKRLIDFMVKKTKLALDNPEFKDFIFSPNNYSFLSNGFNIETKLEELSIGG